MQPVNSRFSQHRSATPFRSMPPTIETSEGDDEDDDNSDLRLLKGAAASDLMTRRSSELESSGVFVAGYTGPIHRWEHPGYQFLKQPAIESKVKTERLFKVIIVGDPTVGKTSFVQRYVNDTFRHDYKGTVGVDFALKVLKRSKNELIKLQLWDIAGQERFTWMTRVYYRDAQGCIVMFDLTNKSTFAQTTKWKNDVDSKCQSPDGSVLPAILLGNKCDLPKRDVDQEEIENAYKTSNYLGWTEVSVKEGLMVDDSMTFLVEAMMSKMGGQLSFRDELSTEDAKIDILSDHQPNKKCCWR